MKMKALVALLGATAIMAIPVLTPDAGFGGAAYAAGRAGSGGQQDSDDQGGYDEPPPAPPPPAPTEGGSDADEIERLAELHTNGILSDEEFAAAKAKILGI